MLSFKQRQLFLQAYPLLRKSAKRGQSSHLPSQIWICFRHTMQVGRVDSGRCNVSIQDMFGDIGIIPLKGVFRKAGGIIYVSALKKFMRSGGRCLQRRYVAYNEATFGISATKQSSLQNCV